MSRLRIGVDTVVVNTQTRQVWHQFNEIGSAARVSGTDAFLWNIMAAGTYTLSNSVDVQLRGRQACIPYVNFGAGLRTRQRTPQRRLCGGCAGKSCRSRPRRAQRIARSAGSYSPEPRAVGARPTGDLPEPIAIVPRIVVPNVAAIPTLPAARRIGSSYPIWYSS
jgi:hypothetical protein